MIRVRDLIVRFGRTTALRLERMDLLHGESVCIAGPNGSGKSTLMRVLAGLLPPTAGRVEGLPPAGQAVLVHQDPYFFTGTVAQNLAWALKRAGRHVSETAVWLERAHARHLAERPASRVSGGEKRRLAIARALAVQPELLLLDEPFAGLDVKHRRIIDEELDGFEGTLVIVSPDGDVHRAHRMIVLDPAQPEQTVVHIG